MERRREGGRKGRHERGREGESRASQEMTLDELAK